MGGRHFFLRPPEPAPQALVSSPSRSIYVGKTKFLRVPFFWDPSKLVNPHLCVCGITGSGKSYFVKTFITRARLVLGTSAVILDWAGEYADWVRSAGGKVVSFGEQGLNLLDLGGASPHQRARQVVESLEMLTDLSSFHRQRRLTEEAIEKAYLSRGFALQRKEFPAKKRLPTLEDVHKLLQKGARRDSEAAEAAHRIRNLLLSSGNSFCASTIRLGELLSGLVCVDLHSLPTESLRSMAGLAILQFIKEKMRSESYQACGGVRLFVVADEAWKIAADERSDIISIVREGRKYGFGLIVASQNPTDVHKSIFASAGTVMAFRLTLSSERDYIRSSLSYSDFFEQQSHFLSVGQALVHLEFSTPQSCPSTFLLSKVDGEELLTVLSIRGDGMNIELEKGEFSGRLVSFGLTDRQASSVLAEFERGNYSLSAGQFASILQKFGHSRASVIALLREIGAGEKELLSLFSSSGKNSIRRDGESALLALDETPAQNPRSKRK